jgi:hypothetical protein
MMHLLVKKFQPKWELKFLYRVYTRDRTNPNHITLDFQKRLLYGVLLGGEHKNAKSGESEGME